MDVGVCEGLETNCPQIPKAEQIQQVREAAGHLREGP